MHEPTGHFLLGFVVHIILHDIDIDNININIDIYVKINKFTRFSFGFHILHHL